MDRNFAQTNLNITHILGINHEDAYEDLILPLRNFLRLPCPSGKISRAALEASDNAKSALRHFWRRVEAWRHEKLDALRCKEEDLKRHYKQIFVEPGLNCKDSWPEERRLMLAKIEAKGILLRLRTSHMQQCANTQAESERIARSEELLRAVAIPAQTTWGTEVALPILTVTSKIKSRVNPTLLDPDVTTDEATVPETGPNREMDPPRVRVRQVAATIFARMFTSTPEQIETRWTDFASAMADAGFSVAPVGGSAVTFRNDANGKNIVFHRPHPSPNITPIVMRKMGKRLTKWFGHDAETFVENDEK